MAPRILIVKLSALGDTIMASTLVGAVRTRWPDAHITWVAGRLVAPLVRLYDGVDRVIEVDEQRLLLGGVTDRIAVLLQAWTAIGRGYDAAFLGHSDVRYGVLLAFCGARERHRVPLGRQRVPGRWSGAVYAGMVADGAPAHFPEIRLPRDVALPPAADRHPLIVIAPGGARNLLRDDELRRWPQEKWVELTRRLCATGHTVVAVGGPSDAAETAACARVGAHDLTGRTDLPTLLALLARADAVVSHDSGVMHAALLVRSPLVALFGPTSPVEFLPPGAAVTALRTTDDLTCAPCYNGLHFAQCADNRCINRVPVDAVVQAITNAMTGDTGRVPALEQRDPTTSGDARA